MLFFIGIIKQKGYVEKIFEKLKIKSIHHIPTSWDYCFSEQKSLWVIITLKSGKIIYGLFGENSFASSDPYERDIYIEKIYNVDKNMKWVDNEGRSEGIYIAKEEIDTIEFLN